MSNGLERNWLQVTCQRSITNGTFSAGVQDFNFSIGGRYGFNPAKSYFRFGVKLAGVGGAQPRVQNNLAMADGVIDNLYNNVYFRAGGTAKVPLVIDLWQVTCNQFLSSPLDM